MSYSDALEDLIDEIQDWQLKTFPNSTPASKFAHLRREIEELSHDVTSESEIADCLFLLIGMAKTQGFDIFRILKNKFDVNRAREWGLPDAEGVVEHVDPCSSCTCCEGRCEQPYTCPHCNAVRPCGDGSHCQACFKPNDPDAADDERRQS